MATNRPADRPTTDLGDQVLAVLAEIRRQRDELHEAEKQLRGAEVSAVVDGRNEARLSWAELGEAMGMSKQAVQQRFGLLCDLARRSPPAPAAAQPKVRPGPAAHGARQRPKRRRQ